MKRKFESNVAAELPKTRDSEPNLPWKLSAEDLDKLNPHGEGVKTDDISSPPLKTRAIFPILLVLTIFVLLSQVVLDTYIENDNMLQSAAKMRQSAAKGQGELAALQVKVAQVSEEKNRLGENAIRLEKRIEDLSDQKELFTAALESLTKKNDEIIIEAPVVSEQR